MTASTDLGELVGRVEAATGPDRVMDFDLHIALVEDALWPVMDRQGRITNPNSRMSDYLATYRDVINADDQDFDFPRYTASLDAALALVERVLPGWAVSVLVRPDEALAHVYGGGPNDTSGLLAAKTPALSILSALLKALQASRGGSSPLRATKSDNHSHSGKEA